MRQQQRAQQQPNPKTQGCHKCGALDHWMKDCPKEEKKLKPLTRYGDECMFSHLINHCPKNPNSPNYIPPPNKQGKLPMQLVEVIPSGTK